ncbi:uncharacterized protein LOC143223856 [Tachypleus tridentatus]|uniref:uncharacterized protein LOC143223856 n=1 Tax=Tachypleus tridentatus TaxID=6853 RepID=UPI003FCFBFEA
MSQLSVLLLLASASLTRWSYQAGSASGQKTSDQTTDITTSDFWRHIDLKSQEIPEEIKQKVAGVDIKETSITVDDHMTDFRGKHHKFTQLQEFTGKVVCFSASDTSRPIESSSSLQGPTRFPRHVKESTSRGFGNSERASISDRGEFINDVVKALKLIRPVVGSPSMSGTFALPNLVKYSTDMGGYVPVAPGATSIIERQPCGNGQSIEMSLDSTPTLVVFEEYDRRKNSALLCLLPRSQGVEIPRGNHPAYLTSDVL